MNIFVLDSHPGRAAKMQCDKHITKMTLEVAQLLSTTWRVLSPNHCKAETYKSISNPNHPIARWVRHNSGNYHWTVRHGLALADEYRKRFGKYHKSEGVIWVHREPPFALKEGKRTQFVQCFEKRYPHLVVPGDPVQGYRRFYVADKARFAKWDRAPQGAPSWWPKNITAKR